MSWSLGEIRTLAIKATRATGFSWGLCEEAGYMVYWLQSAGLPGVEALGLYLDHLITTYKHPHDLKDTCPIQIGVKFSDRKKDPPQFMQGVRQPILMTPFIANTRMFIEGELKWNNVVCAVKQGGVRINVEKEDYLTESADCHWKGFNCGPVPSNWETRVPESAAEHVQKLERFAVRTYAPSTEESRAKGAGAGDSDND